MRYKLILDYNGKNYHGYQIQPKANSIQETLEKCFSLIFRQNINIVGCGRTDTGVSAKNYVAHFDCYDIENLLPIIDKLNRFLPIDIAIQTIEKTSEDFHARFWAKKRTYHYFFHTCKDVFNNDKSWQLKRKVDINLIKQALNILKEYDDFKSFAKTGSDNKTTICKLYNADIINISPNHYYIELTADRFLRNMVRAIVGTVHDVGTKRISLENFRKIIEEKRSTLSSTSAPAHGLYLVKVEY